ncbi:MAG TPA: ComEC/Rec2 family competence protein [Chthonomonadaceae bacterium]|nr:ComEC/Rec2 family competence protein [Chthonomonadaceae bacterium]
MRSFKPAFSRRAAAPLLVALLLLSLSPGCGKRAPNAPNAPAAPGGVGAVSGAVPRADGKTLVAAFLDIGQGDSAVVETPGGKTILLDAGPPGSDDAILNYLRRRGITRLDYVVASHPHADHIGGMARVLDALPFGPVYDAAFATGSQVQERYLTAIQKHGGRITKARAGQSVPIDSGVTMEVLAPRDPLFEENDSDWINNNSVVVRFVYGRTRLLFTGDMEEKERQRLYMAGADLRADVLKVAHHGSRNGTDAEFLGRVQPQVAVLSCEQGNDYGHPHKEALEALRAAQVPFLRTDLQGTITLTCDNQGHIQQQTERQADAAALNMPGNRKLSRPTRPGREAGSRAPSAPPNAPAASSEPSGGFIGNTRSHIYHPANAPNLPAPQNRIHFNSREEAEAAGYRPARNAD